PKALDITAQGKRQRRATLGRSPKNARSNPNGVPDACETPLGYALLSALNPWVAAFATTQGCVVKRLSAYHSRANLAHPTLRSAVASLDHRRLRRRGLQRARLFPGAISRPGNRHSAAG